MRKSSWLVLYLLFAAGLLVLAVLWVSQGTTAAERNRLQFSGKLEDFPKELARVIRAQGKIPKQVEEKLEKFEEMWVRSTFTPQEREEVVSLSQAMLRATHANRAYFVEWQDILMHYMGDSLRDPSYAPFMQVMRATVGEKRFFAGQQYHLLQNTYGFFTRNVLNETPSFEWRALGEGLRPQIEFKPELRYRFRDVTLMCKKDEDSILIHQTSGTYYPYEERWEGRGGKVLWERSHYPEEKVRAELKRYRIDMKRMAYKADSVQFRNTTFLKQSVYGTLEDQLTRDQDSTTVRYPIFTSYDKNLTLKNIIDGVKFTGGCEMRGSWMMGLGTPGNPATFTLVEEDKPLLRVRTERMAFSERSIGAEYAQVTVYMGQDSLFHNGLRFKYDDAEKEVWLSPTKLKITQSPIYSSYHKMTIYFDEIRWRLGQSKLVFGPRQGASRATARFLSDNYFNRDEFEGMLGFGERHPMYDLLEYAYRVRSSFFTITEYARYLRYPEHQVKGLLISLAMKGVILYNVEQQTITILPKLYNLINANSNKIDYDVISFSSEVGKDRANAVLDLKTQDMDVYSVSDIKVSDSANVSIAPRGRFVKVGRNRNLKFDGVVQAGLFTFDGDSIEFNYENYTLDFKKIESAEFDVQLDSLDISGRRSKRRCTSPLRKLTGSVKIDDPTNKSGLKRNEGYPIFESTEKSFVYYDNKETGGGVYNKDKFNFQVEPFTLENLNDFEKSDIHLAGSLNSDSIFGTFGDTLRIRPDLSLGFVHKVGPEGMKLYNGKGTFYSDLDLSNDGLKGAGKLEYLTSVTESPEFFFYPDSTTAVSTSFDIGKKIAVLGDSITYPDVHGYQHGIHWNPSDDEFYALRGEKSFEMFEGQSQFVGNYKLTPKGLEGDGRIDMRKGSMGAKRFQFTDHKLHADTMRLDLASEDGALLAFSSDSLAGEFNFTSRSGNYRSIGASILGFMDALKYRAHADEMDWLMDEDELRFTTPGKQAAVQEGKFCVPNMIDRDSIPSGSIFYSVKEGEESLYFMSSSATYRLKSAQLSAQNVAYVLAADAKTIPAGGKVVVSPKARMHPFKKAVVDASVENHWHTIYDADVRVFSRSKYGASGYINYVDERDSVEVIKLDTVYPTARSEGNYTVAKGYLPPHQEFRLSPMFDYEGKVELSARDSLLYFNGGVRPRYDCPGMKPELMRFMSHINPDSIMIPLPYPIPDMNENHLISGTVVSHDSTHVYPAFSSPRFSYDDTDLSHPRGFLTYDRTVGRFLGADSLVFRDPRAVAQKVELDPKQCRLFTTGLITMPFDFGRPTTHTTGRVIQDLRDTSLLINLFLDLDFHFSKPAMEVLVRRITEKTDLVQLDETQEIYLMGLRERLDTAAYGRAQKQIQLFGVSKEAIEGLDATVSFTNLRMRWDQGRHSFVSQGRLGIGSMMGLKVGRKVNGFLEFYRDYTGDRFALYIELGPNEYYAFVLYGTQLLVNSSDAEFSTIVDKTKRRHRKAPKIKGQPKYIFNLGTTLDAQKVQHRYQQIKVWEYKHK